MTHRPRVKEKCHPVNHPRRLEVLSAIVEDYVHSREPVGSKSLAERHQLGVSSATVRNDMAVLEEAGLIRAPHASAGRVPTDRGYRTFVDQIETIKPLSPAQRKAIASFLDQADDLEQVMFRTVRLLSQLTHQVAVIQYPVSTGERVRHLDLIGMGQNAVLAVIVTSRGQIHQEIAAVDWALSEQQLREIRDVLLSAAHEALLDEVPQRLTAACELLPPSLRHQAGELVGVCRQLCAQPTEQRLAMAGTSYLAQASGEFGPGIGPILDVLEEQVVMLRLFSELDQDQAEQREVTVRIGVENRDAPLNDASVVASGYGPAHASKMGVIGPTRMDYPTTMSAVRAVARYVSGMLRE